MQVASEPQPVLSDIAAVLNLHASHVSVSDNGDVAFVPGWFDDERPVLTWIEPDGRASPIAMVPRGFVPRLSPDGKRVAYLAGDYQSSDLYVRDLERNTAMRITSDGKPKSPGLVWTPDGSSILYGSDEKTGGIYIVSSNGGLPPRKVLDGKWTPRDLRNDRKWLLVTSEEQIAVAPVSLNDSGITMDKPREMVRVVRSALLNNPIFSPDGRWIVYISGETGPQPQIYLRSFEGTVRHVLPVQGLAPIWSSNGQFTTSATLNLQLCTIKPETLRCESPRMLAPHRLATRSAVPMYDVAPDGRILAFLAQPPAKPEPPRVHLLFNLLSARRQTATP
jgi:WD40 repeat protein